ncbi:SMI1/KNR4 family protein [Salinarimonas sp.]|uniref:SMI1/KNR4 family protein n=1 Tax=Salinarimonas sp. TaxID=2766526 RepID=UPI00391BDA45
MAAKDRFRELCQQGISPGPASEESIRSIETQLGIRFPRDYREFLQEFGACILDGLEIYGIIERDMDQQLWQNVGQVAQHFYEFDLNYKNRALIPITEDGTGCYSCINANKSRETEIVAIGPGVDSVISYEFFEFVLALKENKLFT